MRLFGKISILFAGLLLLTHTVLPHQHHGDLDDTEHYAAHESASNWIEYLQLAFHFSPGENHLEDYQTTDSFTFYNYLFTSIEWTGFSDRIPAAKIQRAPVATYLPLFLCSHPFRGPPSLS